MNLWPEPGRFARQLMIWSVRGIACAFPSFFWAVQTDYKGAAAIAGMAAGVATYVFAFAWTSALPVYRDRVDAGAFGWALRAAANTRSALAPIMMLGPDLWLGMVTLSVIGFFRGRVLFDETPQVNSFGWTYLSTVVQGVLVSITMLLLASLVWAWRVWWLARRRKGVAMTAMPANVGSDGSL